MKVDLVDIVPFNFLSKEVRNDVATCLFHAFESKTADDIFDLLDGGPALMPLVRVAPKDIWPLFGCEVSEATVKAFTTLWKKDELFPPVVIDRFAPKGALCEGCHRTLSAFRANKKFIEAIDITNPRIIHLPDGTSTFDFALHRIHAERTRV